jgi:hypothetical protein
MGVALFGAARHTIGMIHAVNAINTLKSVTVSILGPA